MNPTSQPQTNPPASPAGEEPKAPRSRRVAAPQDADLLARLIEEARWGLDWVLKVRFDGGYTPVGPACHATT